MNMGTWHCTITRVLIRNAVLGPTPDGLSHVAQTHPLHFNKIPGKFMFTKLFDGHWPNFRLPKSIVSV